MGAVKITKFLGIAPKISPELLPETAGQIAENCKLYSGDLIPYPLPEVVDNSGRTGVTTQTLYALRDPDTKELKWLTWDTDVDIVTTAAGDSVEQRFYYTGDGVPKVSNYALAINGTAPYPKQAYELGLPLPTTKATTVADSATNVATVSYARDSGNTATIVTASAHSLISGSSITVSGFDQFSGTYSQSGTTITFTCTNDHGLAVSDEVFVEFTTGAAEEQVFVVSGVSSSTVFTATSSTSKTASGDFISQRDTFNGRNVEVTVVDDTTITYFSPGIEVSETDDDTGNVALAGNTQARTYVYTWFTPWDEESIASEPSTSLFIKEGQRVTVSNLPTAPPSGDNFVRGIRLYRTVPSSSGTEYFRLKTLWFPAPLARVERTGNISRVTTADYHNLAIDDRFKISGCTDSSFNITDGIVYDVIDDYTFEYAQTASDVADKEETAGTLYHDAAELQGNTARYWGDGSDYDFVDDFDSLNLFNILITDDYDPPPAGLKGLVAAQNNILVGFVGNELYFSEPGVPHAWPNKYKFVLESEIIAVAAVAGYILVMTDNYPYQFSGSNPAIMDFARIDTLYPCLSKRGVVNMGYGVIYPTHGGLAVYSPLGGGDLLTKLIHDWNTWETELDPTTLNASFYDNKYFGVHDTGTIIFERADQVGGYLVTSTYTPDALFYDAPSGNLYYAEGTSGDVYQWDSLTQPNSVITWKSKVVRTPEYLNLGAARVIADYTTVSADWDQTDVNWEALDENWNSSEEIEFKMWVDGEVKFTRSLNSDEVFRLPQGYKSDKYEFQVTSDVRVRAIQIATTPTSLRSV
jgi:hypothetical protein